jgi:alpha-tubulin suppressor-like RCC1 family protein
VSVGERFVIALDNEGALYSFGQNDFGELGTGDFEL